MIIQENRLKIGIAGKRDIASDNSIRSEIKKTISKILIQENTNSFDAYSAMAKGADTIFAEVVNKEFKQPVKIVLPFDSAEYEKDFSENELEAYKNWINNFGIVQVAIKYTPTNHEQRNEGYFSAGKYISDNCDYMIFVWDELKPSGKGGTAEILGYASKCSHIKGVEIIKVSPKIIDEINEEIYTLLTDSDNRAVITKRKYQGIWLASIFMSLLTALCFAATLSFKFSTGIKLIFSSLELLFIILVFVLIRITKVNKLHEKLLNERLRAEKLRLLGTYYHADIPVTISEITKGTDSELTSISRKMNSAINNSYQSKWYKYYAIKTLIIGQIKYHKNLSENVIGNKTKNLECIKKVIYWVWFYIISTHFFVLFLDFFNFNILILSDYYYPYETGRFFAIALPAFYGAIEGILYFKEWGNFKKQSASMIAYLVSEQKLLDENGLNNGNFLQVLNGVSNAMLADNKSWISVLIKRETPHPIL